MFIHICGIDGSGKTTLVKKLSDYYYNSEYIELSRYSEFVNQVNTLCKKTNSNRWNEFNNKFRSMLWANEIVNIVPKIDYYLRAKDYLFIDRYLMCNKVYSQLENDSSIQLIDHIHESLPIPDFAIYLNVNPTIAAERIAMRGLDLSPKEKKENLEKAVHLYNREISKAKYPVIIIDASESKDNVLSEAIEAIEAQKSKRGILIEKT